MASQDSQHILYGGSVRITYKDKAHRYFRQDLQMDGDWTKSMSVKGVTTMMDDVLEKKGLMTWPMGLALRELFGFYDFKNERGEQMTGYSKGIGTMWSDPTHLPTKEDYLPLILSASKAWTRKKKSGADIGSLVHEAIENFITGKPFAITVERYTAAQEFLNDDERDEWLEKAPAEVEQAKAAFLRFTEWWDDESPKLLGAEQLVYSKAMDFCGTFDGLIELNGKLILCDWKTSNASTSSAAAAPQGVYYSYFLQSAAYAAAWKEMGNGVVDDLLIVSCRKDGGFDTVSASELGLTVGECIEAWRSLWTLYNFIKKTKTALVNNVKVKEVVSA